MSHASTTDALATHHVARPTAGPETPEVPQWLISLPGVPHVVERLGVTEFRRRLFHMSPALLPVGLPFIPHKDQWGPILIGVTFVATIIALTMAASLSHLLKRKGEEEWVHAVLGYIMPIVAALLLIPGRAELGLMTLQIVALGDGTATLGGLMLGGRRLPWNPKKTVSGLICFTLAGSIAATYIYWGEANPAVSVGTACAICGVAALCAGIVESLPIQKNDNLRVGSTALAVGILMTAWLN